MTGCKADRWSRSCRLLPPSSEPEAGHHQGPRQGGERRTGPSTDPSTGRRPSSPWKEQSHEGIRRPQGQPRYAVIYEGVDPISGRERRSWHAAGTERADAERLAARLDSERNDSARSLTFGAYLTSRWLPGKRTALG